MLIAVAVEVFSIEIVLICLVNVSVFDGLILSSCQLRYVVIDTYLPPKLGITLECLDYIQISDGMKGKL